MTSQPAPRREAMPFAVTAPPDLTLGADRAGSTTFIVTNLTGRPVRARMVPRGRDGAEDGWMAVVGDREVPMGIAATATVNVSVTVPAEAPGGRHLLVLEVVPEDDTESVTGQAVTFTAPPGSPVEVQPKRRWLKVVLIVVGSLLALIGLLVVILIAALVIGN